MSERINPLYTEGGEAMESEIKRMTELEWPLEASSKLLLADLRDKTVGDVGAGPNPNLGKLVELRGGKYVAVDRNFAMAKKKPKPTPMPFRPMFCVCHSPIKALIFCILDLW